MPPKKTTKKNRVATKDSKDIKAAPGKRSVKKKVAKKSVQPSSGIAEDMDIDAEPAVKELGSTNNDKPKKVKRIKKDKVKKRTKMPISMYKKIAYTFFFLTIVMLSVVFYFSFAKLSIKVTPSLERISNSVVFDIYDESIADTINVDKGIVGLVEKVELDVAKTIEASGEKIISEEIVGEVTVINTATYSQPLVATTRLLSPDDKLFRTKETILVPAGGKVKVEVYPDKMGTDMAIGPTKFSIPGLSAVRQDKIYAESSEAFQHKKQIRKLVKDSDIEDALAGLKKSLIKQAERQFSDGYKGYDTTMYSIDDESISYEADQEVGAEVDEFSITMKGDVIVVAYNENDVASVAEAKLISSTPSNRTLTGFNADEIGHTLNGVYFDQKKASIKASFEGRMVLTDDSGIIDKHSIIGLSREQLNDYLKEIDEISSYEFSFFPSFVTKVPRLVDRIEIIIQSE